MTASEPINSLSSLVMQNKTPAKQRFSKIMPLQPKQSKEDLYAAALQAKSEANQVRDDNNRLQSRIAYLEYKCGQNDATGHVNILLKQLNA